MRNSPRKRSGAAACSTPVEIFSLQQLFRTPIGELRHLASEKHGIKNAGLLKKPELLNKLRDHFEHKHGVEVKDERAEAGGIEVSPISQTIDKLRSRIKDKKSSNEAESGAESPGEDLVGSADRFIELAEHVLTAPIAATSGQVEVVTEAVVEVDAVMHVVEDGGVHVIEEDGLHVIETTVTEHFDPSEVISEEVISEEVITNSGEGFYEEYITSDNVEIVESGDVIDEEEEEEEEEYDEDSMDGVSSSTHPAATKYKLNQSKVCHAYVVAKTVKELRDLGRDMLRIHAENHGIDHASRLRMPELLKEVIEHYNGVHGAGLEVSRLEMLKLNMLKLKKIKVDVREKTPPPDFSQIVPKNVVPLEEQVHHVYEKRPDVCTVDIIVNNLKDMLALGTSILRPEASKHRVANSSRKQKLQVVEELWEHYLKFHLKETESNEVVEEEYESDGAFQGYRHAQADFIVVREEDIVQGEEIQAVAEEIAE